MQILYDENATKAAKEKIGKYNSIMEIWRKKYSGKKSIGNVTNLCRLHKPTSNKDFCEKYFKYASENITLPIKDRGLTEQEFIVMSKCYMRDGNAASGNNYDLELYMNDALHHTITQTYDGQSFERLFRDYIERLGYECDVVDGEIDANYGIDIVVKKDGKTLFYIQVKPYSFFLSNKEYVNKDRVWLCHKYEDTLKDFGYKTYYAIHYKDNANGSVKWLKNGDKFLFRINNLFRYDKNDIDGTFTRNILPKVFEFLPS